MHGHGPGHRAIVRFAGYCSTGVVGPVHADSRGVYGYRAVTAALHIESGLVANHELVASIMSNLAIHGLPTSKCRRRNLIATRTTSDLVNREFTALSPKQLWITYITEDAMCKGRVFLCVVLDVFARKAVAFELNNRPPKTLEWRTLAEVFEDQIRSLQQTDVALPC